MSFIGRRTQLEVLVNRLERVRRSGSGLALALRGRRQVGKSRLVQEFCDRAEVPYLFFSATKGASPVEEIGEFIATLRESSLVGEPDSVVVPASGSWPDAFRSLDAALPHSPSVVVLDELPWLAEQDPIFDGALQTAWDRRLRTRPVLLLLLGSDIHMMERLTAYDSPFYGRADNMVLDPLNPAEVSDFTGLSGSEAVDAHLITGGLPGILRSWPHGMPPLDLLRRECNDPAAPLFGIPESSLMAEFPAPDQTRRVLEAIGTGDRTHATIAATAGGGDRPIPSGSLTPILGRLVHEKRVLAKDEPLSTRPGKPALYRVADSNLRLHLGVTRSAQELARRGRPDAAFRIIERRWSAWRGRAVEPLVRTSLEFAIRTGELPWAETEAVGGWWNRRFEPEVDLVGADRAPIARNVHFAGSIKWLGSRFDGHDFADLIAAARQVPGYDSGLAVVSRSGVVEGVGPLDLVWGPDDIVAAWR